MSASLQVIGSSSKGNTYILNAGDDKLIIELGCRWKDIKRALDYNFDGVKFCICTHGHNDHAFSVPNALAVGLDVYGPPSLKEKYPKVKAMEHMKRYAVGDFLIIPLMVEHNAECFAYVIDHPAMGRLVFCTDAKDFPYTLSGVYAILIEVNYCEETILDNMMEGNFAQSHFENHMNLYRAMRAVGRLQSPRLQFVGAIHLSDTNSDEKLIKSSFREHLGINISCLNAGDVCNLRPDDF